MKTAKAQRNASMPKSVKTLLNTAVRDAVSDQQDVEDQMPPEEADEARALSSKSYGEDRISPH